MNPGRALSRSIRSLLGAAVLGIAAVVAVFGESPAPGAFDLDPDWGSMGSGEFVGVALNNNSMLVWTDGAIGCVAKNNQHSPFGFTTNVGGGQADAGSFNDEFSIQLTDSGVLYLMANATGMSDLAAGISVPGATAVGDVFEIGGTRYTHVLKADGPTSARVYLVNLTNGTTTSTPLFTRTGVSPAALGTYLATGGNSLADVRFLFARPDRPEFIDVSFTGDVRQFGVPSDFVGVWDTVFYSDLAFDPRDNKLYVVLNDGSGYAFRGNFTPAAALPSSPYDPQPRAEATGGNTITFSFETRAGLPYTIQRSSDLVTWTDVETILGTGARHTHEHPLTGQAVFFRVSYLH
ncbi:MAG: hypothetical protein KBC32_11120 [Candidatus Didemnitutus sp.]|nr:hypothetical protein [Candidatus Didemnitutus sp.]